jgi:hypothetical protein
MNITILVIGYLFTSIICAIVLVSASIIGGRAREGDDGVRHEVERSRPEHVHAKVIQPLDDQVVG